jgi:signal transduction histidine kinase
MRRVGLQTRILSYFGLLLVAVVVGALTMVDLHLSERLRAAVREDLETSWRVYEELLDTRGRGLITATSLVSELSLVRDPSFTGDALYLEYAATEINRLVGSDVVLLTDRVGVILARTDQRWEVGDVFDEATSVARALRGERATSMWVHEGGLYQMVSVPVRLPSGLVGTLSAGYRVDADLARELSRLSGKHVAFLVGDGVVAASRPLTAQEGELIGSLASRRSESGPAYSDVELGAGLPAVVVAPFFGLGANQVGAYAILRSVTTDEKELRALENQLVGIGGVALLVALLVGWMLSRSMSRPLESLAAGARELESGNYDYGLPRPAGSREVAELTRSFDSMRRALRARVEELASLTAHLEDIVRERTSALEDALAENRRLLETLRGWNDELERKVEERTAEVARAQQMLIRQDRMAAIGRLAAGVAHEINNPLGILSGFAEGLLDRARDPSLGTEPAFEDFPEHLRLIGVEVDRLKTIVQKFLNFAHNRTPQKTRFDANEVVRQVVELLANHARREGKRLVADLSPEPLWIEADPEQLKQVLLNLALNGLDAIERGGRVMLSSAEEGVDALLRVEDDGLGIPEELRSKIFEPFFSTKPPERGTGLGLALCQDLVHENGGEIALERSALGVGSTFALRIPRILAEKMRVGA